MHSGSWGARTHAHILRLSLTHDHPDTQSRTYVRVLTYTHTRTHVHARTHVHTETYTGISSCTFTHTITSKRTPVYCLIHVTHTHPRANLDVSCLVSLLEVVHVSHELQSILGVPAEARHDERAITHLPTLRLAQADSLKSLKPELNLTYI